MRRAAAAVALATALLAGPATAAEKPPPLMAKLLARDTARAHVTVAATTTGLRYRVWLHALSGRGTANATVRCEQSTAGVGGTAAVGSFRFGIEPGTWHELWRYGGGRCGIDVTVTGAGPLTVELRGR